MKFAASRSLTAARLQPGRNSASKLEYEVKRMPHDTELHLVIPGICGPLAETQSLKTNLVVNQWVRALSKSSCLPAAARPSSGNLNDVIAAIFDLKVKDDFPSAALTMMANGMYDDNMYYMHTDPVHLQADMDHAVLTSSNDLEISDDESLSLCKTLNQHFNQDGLTFFLLNKDQWLVSSKDKINLKTTPLADATGRNVNFILPQGEHAAHWKQVMTEAQMLMHSHEVNALREASGLLSINSLWLHGSGEPTSSAVNGARTICSNSNILKGLATQIECDHINVPETVNEYAGYLLSCDPGSASVLHLSELEHLVNYTDVNLWMEQLTEQLELWVYPLLKIAKKNNIKVTLYPCNEKKYQFSNYDSVKYWLKFWRHARAKDMLKEYISSYSSTGE